MFDERRRHRRYIINRIAKFQTDSGALPRDCMITDISKQGARLFADGMDVPDQFDLRGHHKSLPPHCSPIR
ncbi:MAG: hypothetical protein EXQ83_00190 [Xanthobacteraceae bacterium]|nr:hypothetical protein [Xanthobacteraceae bacterium]